MIYIYNFSLIFDIFNTHKNGKNHTQILLLNHKPRSHNEKTNPSEETKILQSLHVAGTAAFNCRCVGHSAGGLALRDAIASCMAAADMPCWGGVQFLDVFAIAFAIVRSPMQDTCTMLMHLGLISVFSVCCFLFFVWFVTAPEVLCGIHFHKRLYKVPGGHTIGTTFVTTLSLPG